VTFPYIGFSPPEMVVKQTQTQLTLLPIRIRKHCAYGCWNKHVCSRTRGDKNTSRLGPSSAHTWLRAPSILCPRQTLSILSPSSNVPHLMAMLSTDSAHIVRPRCPLSQRLRSLMPMPPMRPWLPTLTLLHPTAQRPHCLCHIASATLPLPRRWHPDFANGGFERPRKQ
jgi:hypothetical protein